MKTARGWIPRNYQLHLIILIPIVYVLIFDYFPMYGAQIAFKNFIAVRGIWGSPWVGFHHFLRFFDSPIFWNLIFNTVMISLYSLAAGFPIPIFLALALNSVRSSAYRKTVQMVTYMPYFISQVVLVGMMYQFFSPKFGAVNLILKFFGANPVYFMGQENLFRHLYVWSGIWQTAGWGTIIYLAALSAIDPSLHEAAIVDGAGKFKRLLHIDLPGIQPTIIILLIMNAGRIMAVGFEKAFLMQNPVNLGQSEVISTYVYKIGLASSIPNYSYASAIGLFNSLINLFLLIAVNSISRKVSETSLW